MKDIFIDELVQQALSGVTESQTGASNAQANMNSMRSEIESLRGDRDLKKLELDSMLDNQERKAELGLELRAVKTKILALSQKLDSEKDREQQHKRSMDVQERKLRMQILSEADVICATLSGSGHDYMAQLPFDFETVIIDEAAQSVELSCLIPLKYGCKRCILVGGKSLFLVLLIQSLTTFFA